MINEHSDPSGTVVLPMPSAAEFAANPREFIEHLADRMKLGIDELTLHKLTERMTHGASREEIIRSLQNIKGEEYPTDVAAVALNFARFGHAGAALVIDNVVSFSPSDAKGYVIYAFSQVLNRRPSNVELAQFTHRLETGAITRIYLLSILNDIAISNGREVLWDHAEFLTARAEESDVSGANLLVETSGFRTLSRGSSETLTLCRFVGDRWELAPSMIPRADDVDKDSWKVSDGFVLTGPKAHLGEGQWLLDLDIVQPDNASLVIDIVANAGIDRLLHITTYGNVRGSFSFEKLRTHAFTEVRLRVQNAVPQQWLSIQNLGLRKIG